ncbi:MAG: hypothetical protein HY901_34160 [Deltaproteobacteria bacterium]|nr:hypothetical protein [Deltaproteobacteria bacterium]
MGLPIRADVVNAFLIPAIEQLRVLAGNDTTLERMELAREAPPAPYQLRMTIHGQVEGIVYWVFEPELVRTLATKMSRNGDEVGAHEDARLAAAISTLIGLILGNARQALLAAGYSTDIDQPERQADSLSFRAPGLPSLIVSTPVGRARITYGIRLAAPAAPHS